MKTNYIIFRFLFISILYFLLNHFFVFGYLLSIKIFPLLLTISLMTLLFYFLLFKKKSRLICIINDFFFLVIFSIQISIIIYWIQKTPGEAGFGIFEIIMYLPIILLFIAFSLVDIIKSLKEKKYE